MTSSNNPSTWHNDVSFTAVVTPNECTGTVTFLHASATLGVIDLFGGGSAELTVATLHAGSHTITAVYSGDSSCLPSTSSSIVQIVKREPATITLSSSANPSVPGQAVTLTAKVESFHGIVTFLDGTTVLGTGSLLKGTATFSTTSLTAGNHSLTAKFEGNQNYSPVVSSVLTQGVN